MIWYMGVGGGGFVAGLLVMAAICQAIISERGPRDRNTSQPASEPTFQLPDAKETKNPLPIGSAMPDSGNLEMTSQQFVRRYVELDGRFAEQEAFIKRADRKRLRWKVIFTSPVSIGDEVTAYFDVPAESANETPLFGSPVRWATFPANFRDRLYSLKRGDLIEITGILRITGGNRVEIRADDFDIISTPMPTSSPEAIKK